MYAEFNRHRCPNKQCHDVRNQGNLKERKDIGIWEIGKRVQYSSSVLDMSPTNASTIIPPYSPLSPPCSHFGFVPGPLFLVCSTHKERKETKIKETGGKKGKGETKSVRKKQKKA